MSKLHPQLGKIGIVLTGGFLRGAFQVGVLKAFHEVRLIPAYIVGVSVGAINGAAFAAGKMDILEKTYREIAERPTKFVYKWNPLTLLRAFFWSKSILVNTPLKEVVIEERMGPQEIIASPIKVDIVTTDFQEAKEVIFSNKNPEHAKPDILINALLASAAMPVIFPPWEWKGHQLFDGGVVERTPITFAIREGCDTVFLILTEARDSIRTEKKFNTIYAITKRSSQFVGWRGVNKDLERGREVNDDIRAYQRLKEELGEIVTREAKQENVRVALDAAIGGVLERDNFSFQKKRLVNIIVIEPEPSRSEEAGKMLDYESIPRYLEDGYAKAKIVLKELETASL